MDTSFRRLPWPTRLSTGTGLEVHFVGTARGIETRLVPEAGFSLHLIEVGPLKNVSFRTRLSTFTALPRSVFACRQLIRDFKPGVVLGIGGYASGPGVVAALMHRVPTMLFEPNAMPGLANRLVGKHVQAAAINFPAAARWFRNAEVTGIPVRPGFFAIQPPAAGPPHLLIFGGSQGARIFNVTLPAVSADLLKAIPGLTILHQCGTRHAEVTQAAYAATGADPARWEVKAFLADMPAYFADASLVMSRSGASSVAELAAAGKPSLLVPFAAAADDHQTRNAEEMVKAGAAVLLREQDILADFKIARNPQGAAGRSRPPCRHGCRSQNPSPSRCRRANRGPPRRPRRTGGLSPGNRRRLCNAF